MFIGERIKKARLERGMSQEELGNLLDVSKVSICGYENGGRFPSLETFENMVKYLKLSPNYILGYDVEAVLDEEVDYKVKLSKEELKVLNEFKKRPVLYNKLMKDTKRMVELIDKSIIN